MRFMLPFFIYVPNPNNYSVKICMTESFVDRLYLRQKFLYPTETSTINRDQLTEFIF